MRDIRQDDQLAKFNEERIDLSDIEFMSVDSVEQISVKDKKVYDLKVDDIPNYHTAGGIVHNGGKRKGAAAVYLDTHHPDILDFLQLKDNTGDPEKRTYNLNLANWVPDLFMKRVLEDGVWSLFSPVKNPELFETYGDEFDALYIKAEEAEQYVEQVQAQELYARMMRTLSETGNGWICWRDHSNKRMNMSKAGGFAHSSNLCTEIILPTSSGRYVDKIEGIHTFTDDNKVKHKIPYEHHVIQGGEVAVCNLGSVNLSNYVIDDDKKIDWPRLRKNVDIAVRFLDKVIDKNFYPIPESKASNSRWRPIGLGVMGFQDVLFKLRYPFESQEAIDIGRAMMEEIYYQALKTSCELAKELGPFSEWKSCHVADGNLQFDLLLQDLSEEKREAFKLTRPKRWNDLKEDIKNNGVRNSVLIAIAPTATISSITGVFECIEPQVSNIFKRETLSGEFLMVNKYLINDLKEMGLWNEEMMDAIKLHNGSVQNISNIPDNLRELYKTAWEISNKYIIDHAAQRYFFVDQAQSVNLFMENATIEKLSSMYMYAWQEKLKTTYYLRSRSATRIEQTTVRSVSGNITAEELEDPLICEACT